MIGFKKTLGYVAVKVKNANHLTRPSDRDHEFALGSRITGNVSREILYPAYPEALTGLGRETADPLSKGDPNAGWRPLKGTEYELGSTLEIKADPAHAFHFLINERSHVGGIRDRVTFARKQCSQRPMERRVKIGSRVDRRGVGHG